MKYSDFNDVYWIRAQKDKKDLDRHFLGSFFHDGHRTVKLSDYYGMLHGLTKEGPATEGDKHLIDRLHSSQYIRVVPRSAPTLTTASEPPPDNTSPKPPRPPSVFDYKRNEMEHPHSLEVSQGKVLLDGNEVTHPEINKVLENVRSRAATLRYRRSPKEQAALQKMEELLTEMVKSEELTEPLETSLDRQPEFAAEFDRDPSGHPNQRSVSKIAHGPIRALIWMNDHKGIVKEHGYEASDNAIKAIGDAVSEAMKGGQCLGCQRFSAGEFHVSANDPTHIHLMLRKLRDNLQAHPGIHGKPLTVSVGIGPDFQGADQALTKARGLNDPHPKAMTVFSLIPGQEGPVD